jgi:hypothetical protein
MGKILSIVAAVFFGALFFALLLRDYLWRRRHPPEEEAAERKALEERILSPDWTFYERYLQRPAPAALRELFADRKLATSCGLEFSKSDGISTFNPLDEGSLVDTADQLGFDVVPFATSDCGDAIFLRPGKDESDTVHIAYHDDPGKGLLVFADSVAAMLEQLRKVNDVG